MKVRILVVDPFHNSSVPLVPLTLFEQDGEVLLMGDYWARTVPAQTLEQVTLAQIRAALPVIPDAGGAAFLSEPQECPFPDLMSPNALRWRQSFWEATAQSLREQQILKAS